MVNEESFFNLASIDSMPTPAELRAQLPLDAVAARTVSDGRRTVRNILERRDPRLLAVVGPCSIHDPEAGLEYARQLRQLALELSDTLYIVMRVYFEKPRTSIGWKGLINDPGMDNTFRIADGMRQARSFLLEVNRLGLPAAAEALDPVSPHYLAELISWAAIGARTTESQTHREMSSGLPMPVGFKNGTDGSVDTAVNAILSTSHPHSFLGIDGDGRTAIIRTLGNGHSHLVLRGGGGRPNYDSVSVALAERALAKARLAPNIVIDCAHGNSYKDHRQQAAVMTDLAHQIRQGNRSILGTMIESFLEPGNQAIPSDLAQLRYGCSVTDACVGWNGTAAMLRDAAALLRDALPARLDGATCATGTQ
ncbi:3-deoxy-7-phosphoheptulonate synthase [Janthinobacterium agaricidamnosum NBRC 102515 = DSM 9628]|uniref:Phospho-2-dehydro-3-deoxyheptonate aldolase n=1 Tax=Janthinobacterium agaricidamnosum NBRC 102515 = DSM 9628 TaxID=1349767 RepID=W0V762_9BURK|nr:3-deoxy-7-phosphoheptulonate synthase [Janthinobacterium agaricidamnosum NBRC 102515 = DSM 9628]